MQLPSPLWTKVVAEFEGFRAHAYLCPAGKWTVGYGLTTGAFPGCVVTSASRVTEPEALMLLTKTLEHFADKIYPLFKRVPTGAQGLAMLSLAYNIGLSAFSRSSVLRRFNQGDIDGAAEAFLNWNKATVKGRKVVMRGLALRRERERSIFLGLLRSADLG